jgi:hypothetical protein
MNNPVYDRSQPSAHIQSAESFRGIEEAFKAAQARAKLEMKQGAVRHRQQQVDEMIKAKITDSAWDELVDKAREAADHGEKQYLLLRFPSDLCTDDSRAINNPPNPRWPETLRGEAADVYRRWDATLRPHGFHLSAQVLEFPDGKPGDVGLFLLWGENV